MASKNALKNMSAQTALYKKKYQAFLHKLCGLTYNSLIDAIKEKTPVDFGLLREGWSKNSTMSESDGKIIMTIYNPADYAAHIEYGYNQKPGMMLKMKMHMGRLRFVEFLGWTRHYGVGDPTGKVEPDENGFYTIVTRKRHIPGRYMMTDSVKEMRSELPKRYNDAFAAFSKRNQIWPEQK